MKKFLSLLLSFVIVCSCFSLSITSVSASSVIESAISWAVDIANDNSHGYSWDGRWGPDYDCSSLVISAFRKAGLSLNGATTTRNMRSVFTAEGFTWIPASQINLSNSNSLQRGDILLDESSHTEIYLGNGQNVGAHRGYMSQWCSHSNSDGKYHRHGHYSLGEQKGDQDGGEISVAGYYNYPWDGILRYTDNSDNNPVGVVDSIVGGTNSITIRGWAFDIDDTALSLEIHVYVGGSAGSGAPGYVFIADAYRPDVNNVYNTGDYHGFDFSLSTPLTGSQTIFVYAINTGLGETVLLESTSINIEGDTTKPTISEITVSDITLTSYTVTCKVNDNTQIASVKFPSWHSSQEGDNAKWYEASVSNGMATCIIPISELGGYNGKYITHIYAYDVYGNVSSASAGEINVDLTPISEREYVNLGNLFYCSIQNIGIKKVLSVEDDNVVSKSNNDLSSQQWKFTQNEDGSYTIMSIADGKYLDSEGSSGTTKTNVIVNTPNNSDSQKWYIIKAPDEGYFLLTKQGKECVLDLYKYESADGTNIQLHTLNSSKAQKWKFNQVDPTFSLGDTNLDGVINVRDVTQLQKYIVYGTELNEATKYICDTNLDGNINVRDVTQLQKYCVGMITEFV